jgi:hypothetical protein
MRSSDAVMRIDAAYLVCRHRRYLGLGTDHGDVVFRSLCCVLCIQRCGGVSRSAQVLSLWEVIE